VSEKDINPAARKGFRRAEMPPELAARLAVLYQGGSFDASASDRARVEFDGARQVVETEPEAARMLEAASDWLLSYADEMGENTGEASVAMIRRSYEMVAKVSFILAIPSGVRTADHVRWAFAYVREELDAKIALVFANDNASQRPDESVAARVMNYLDPEKGVSVKVLANRMKMKTDALEAILQRMQAAGMVRSQLGLRAHKGAVPVVWVPVRT